jgi:hypothetical protein
MQTALLVTILKYEIGRCPSLCGEVPDPSQAVASNLQLEFVVTAQPTQTLVRCPTHAEPACRYAGPFSPADPNTDAFGRFSYHLRFPYHLRFRSYRASIAPLHKDFEFIAMS